jgi:hypothetical protein
MCKFCLAEMLRIILENQDRCARNTNVINEMLTMEMIKYLSLLLERK